MNRTATIVVAVLLTAASTARAQAPANPLSANFKASWANISGLLARMACFPLRFSRADPLP